ncbi:hypothetical protein QN399_15935 [Pseudomonas sp. 10C3]|uniref:hypothetical protein n=1 Tax=Pseudomonas sp. 10C3 TaxID=3118753 RepID=UPI002E813B15|nr:hypothetical protein [Pseudomonas sp. 10C3]MEE3507727.1 hypothetical protein [Pseudomonas sp. 10C3]
MAGQGFLARVAGRTKQIFGIQTSAGAADAGKIPALDATGKIDTSMMPTGIGANSVSVPASEAIGAGKFVNLWSNAGVLSMRLADNSNGRPAHGYVNTAVASAGTGTAYRLNTVNAGLTGLVAGGDYWLGLAGGVLTAALDPVADTGKLDQYLGLAKSATELATVEYDTVTL